MTATDDANRALAVRFWTSHAKGDQQAYLDTLTDDCVLKVGVGASEGTVPYHGTYSGKAAIQKWLDLTKQNRIRDYCRDVPVTPGATPPPSSGPQAANLVAANGVVVGTGTIQDKFTDGTPMQTTDFVIVLHINQTQNKISQIQFFHDTAGTMVAWQKRGAGS